MPAAPLPADEPARLDALRRLNVLDTPPEQGFDDLTRLAAIVCGTPIAVVSLIDADRLWFKSTFGLDAVGLPRGGTLCEHAVASGDLFVVPDTEADPRFVGLGIVAGPPHARFYAGMPLVTPDGFAVGTLCAIDRAPRTLTPAQADALRALARQVVAQLQLRTQVAEQAKQHETFRVLFEQSSDAHLIFDERDGIIDCNHAAVAMLRLTSKEQVLALHPAVLSPEFQPCGRRSLDKCLDMDAAARRDGHHRFDWTHRRADGEEFPCEVTLTPVRLHGRSVLLVVWHDLTERVKAEAERRESEGRFRLVWDESGEGMRLTDADGTVVAVNPAYCRLVGRPADELVGRPLTAAHAAGRADGREKHRRRFVARAVRRQEETAVELWDGRRRWFEVGDAYLDLPAQPPLLLTVFRDVTARKAAERALRESEERFRAFMDHSPAVAYVVDEDGRAVYINEPMRRHFGITDADWLGKTEAERFPPDVARAMQERNRAVLESGQPVVVFEHTPAADGTTDVWRSYKFPLTGVDGRRYLAGMAVDVTAEKRAEDALRESEARFRAVVEQAADAVFLHDPAGVVIDANRRACEGLGYTRDELVGMSFRGFDPFLSADGHTRLTADLGDDPHAGRFVHFESRHRRKDGSEFPVEVRMGLVELNGRPHRLSIARDITERRQAEAALRESEERFRAAMEGSLDAVFFLVAERDAGGTITDFRFVDLNPRGAALLRRAREDVLGRRLCELLPVNRTDGFFDKYVRVVETGESLEEEFPIAADITARWLHHKVVKVGDGVAITSQDVTRRKLGEIELRASEERFDLAVRGSRDGIWDWDLRTGRVYFSPRWKEMLGFAEGEIAGHADEWRRLVHPDDLPHAEAALRAYFAGTAPRYGLEIRMRHKDGTYRWISTRGMAQFAADGTPVRMAGSHTDVTAIKRAEAELRLHQEQLITYQQELEVANARLHALATTDRLTGVKNRGALNDRLNEEFDRAVRHDHPLSVVLLDVDHFKQFNDTFGHPAGDAVLQRVADLLRDAVRGTDFVARYGGEEFAVLLPDTDYAGAMALAERLRRAVAEATWRLRAVTVSVGVGTLGPATPDGMAIVQEADNALYCSKQGGRNRVSYGSGTITMPALRR